MGMPMDTWSVNEERLDESAFLEQVTMVLEEKKKMLAAELSRFTKGLLFCYFESPDIIQHMFWRYVDNENPLYEKNAPEEYKNVIVRRVVIYYFDFWILNSLAKFEQMNSPCSKLQGIQI